MARLEILIPTYGRRERLIVGLEKLSNQVAGVHTPEAVAISISDNASSDGTWEALQAFARAHSELNVRCRRQSQNVGLEANVVALLQSATSDWVMYLADDDLLPEGYLQRLLELTEDVGTTCAVPGVVAQFADGSYAPAARATFGDALEDISYDPSLRTCALLGGFGHQISGVSFRRDGTLEAYLARPEFRNLYPFIFFVGFNALRGRGWYLQSYQVAVLQGQETDWSYDSSYLLRDVLANFRALFPHDSWKATYCGLRFIWSQPGRLQISRRDPARTARGYIELMRSPRLTVQTRAVLPLMYGLVAARLAVRRLGPSLAARMRSLAHTRRRMT